MKSAISVLFALMVVGLSGCGGSSDKGSGNPSSDGSNLPKCSKVWKVGATLNLDTYEGCDDGTDASLQYETKGCYDADSNYIGQFSTYKDRVWVLQKGTSSKTGLGGTPGKVTDVKPTC